MGSPQTLRLCLVEDDPIMGESLCYRFELEGFECDWYKTAKSAMGHIGKKDYAVLISDIRLPDMDGKELYRQLLADEGTTPPTIFVTGHGSISDAVELLKDGACDYITKPFNLDTLIEKVRAVSQQSQIPTAPGNRTVLGISSAMRAIEKTLSRVSAHGSTVLITGESGVGKEYVARYLHRSAFAEQENPFIAVNCGAIPESLLEAELFGYEKGAFTGASRTKQGVFEQAHGGTLFLDEIGEMPAHMQVRLLRVIQEREVVRVGGEQAIKLDIRLACATNCDLKEMVTMGTFREDLYYRINVIHIHVPPLRERREDILWFTRLFLDELESSGDHYLLPSAEEQLSHYPWPGNLRELRHCIERAVILSPQPAIDASVFNEVIQPEGDAEPDSTGLKVRMGHFEQQLLTDALLRHNYQINETALELGISRKSLWEKMRKYHIKRD